MDGPDIARLTLPDSVIAHCRLPAWESGEHVSRSAPSSIGVSFTAQRCDIEISGLAQNREVAARGLVVTGAEAPSWLRVDQASELLEVSASASFRAAVADELRVAGEASLADLNLAEDPVAWAISRRLRQLARRPGADTLEADSLVRHLFGRVFIHCFGGRPRVRGDGGLDPRRVARVIDYLESNPDKRASLAELADVAALSPFHFHRSFRRTFGCTPHRFVAMRRAERAAAMLAAGSAPKAVVQAMRFAGPAALRAALSDQPRNA